MRGAHGLIGRQLGDRVQILDLCFEHVNGHEPRYATIPPLSREAELEFDAERRGCATIQGISQRRRLRGPH